MRHIDLPKTAQYEAVEFLGEGLNSRVYRGFRKTHENLPKQEVAIKIFKKSKEVQDFEHRFQKLVTVRSRYCVGLLGWEIIGDQVAIIMDYIHGVSLSHLVAQTSLSPDQKNEILAQLQRAIDELHGFGITHGDLSAANIMIDTTGQLRLIDYGFGQTEMSQDIIGSPRFLSPERWLGQPATLGDDIFSYGLLARDLLSNELNKKESHDKLRARSSSLLLNCLDKCFLPESSLREFETIYVHRGAIQNELADLIKKNQKIYTEHPLTTLIVKAKTLVFARTQISKVVMTTTMLLFCSILAFPTLSGGSFVTERAFNSSDAGYLEFRTQIWFEVELNGQKLGYTPLKTLGLAPGTYALRWKTENRQGIKLIHIKKSELKVLRDIDLL